MSLKGIGGSGTVIFEGKIQITFKELGTIIDVDFAVMKDDFPTFLSNRDMIPNGLDISLQGFYLHIGPLRQSLCLDNYFFTAHDTPYELFTEGELKPYTAVLATPL